jgi:mono/diheme cytochrome c family protein
MKRWQKVLVSVVLIVGALLSAGISATIGWTPFVGPKVRPLTGLRIEPSPARLARGEYLVRSVAGCLFCHSDVDPTTRGLPIKQATTGGGRVLAADGMPWLSASNISSDAQTGAGNWTDDMIARAIREGIGHDDRTLFPMMPYQNYRHMSDEDLASVITYIRSLPAVRQEHPRTAVPFPVSRLINSAPQPVETGVPTPDLGTPEKRGAYLVTLGSCGDCHTPRDGKGAPLPGLAFSGGGTFGYEGARQAKAASNLTPSPSGIPYYDEALFLEVIRTGRVRERELSDVMPWALYRNMTDGDLKSIFAYLKTLQPVDHYVDNALPPTKCAKCNLEHGGGERNKK